MPASQPSSAEQPHVALASCSHLPLPDPDGQPLLAALAEEGIAASLPAWDDEGIDWAAFDAVIVRSTWDYVQKRDAFVRWAERVQRVSRLANPAEVIRWNTDKTYLRDRLERQGIDIVPTLWLTRGEEAETAMVAVAERGWGEVVVKPTISAGSFATERFAASSEALASFLSSHLRQRSMMIQPYLRSVEAHGERSHVFIDGRLSHVTRKSPRFAEGPLEVSDTLPPIPAERELAERCYAIQEEPLLYARIDLVLTDDGRPAVMELELTEPYLMLDRSPEACTRFAAAIGRLARGAH